MKEYPQPSCEEFMKGCNAFQAREGRVPSMYKVASFLVEHWWGRTEDMADGLGVLLLTWNQAFYRYGSFNVSKLKAFLDKNLSRLEHLRKRDISSLVDQDEMTIITIFEEMLEALRIDSENPKVNGRKSPVAVAKALHILAPNFFPLWDDKIAKAYGVYYNDEPAKKYLEFCRINRQLKERLGAGEHSSNKPFLKLMDEYNYAKYTGRWV